MMQRKFQCPRVPLLIRRISWFSAPFLLALIGYCDFAIGQSPKEATADETVSKRIPARTMYLGRRISDTMGHQGAPWLIRETREIEENPSVVLEQLGIQQGMVVCDMGCGNGFYTLPLAKKVGPEGKVLAVDIQPEMLHLLALRAKEAKVENVQMVQGTVVDPRLEPGSNNILLLVDVYHEFSNPEEMLGAIRKSLKKDGLIALVEFRGEDPRVPIKPLHKMTKKQILKEYEANGFKLAKEFDGLPIQHLMFFGVDPNWSPKENP